MLLRRLLTGSAILLSFPTAPIAQLPKRLERCLPNPTLAQEIRDMQKEVEPEKVTLHVTHVEFDSKSGIPLELQREISTRMLGATFEEDADTDYLKEAASEIAEVVVREALQNKGYFRVLANAKLNVLRAEGPDVQVAAPVSTELGSQYWLGEIQFVTADPDQS